MALPLPAFTPVLIFMFVPSLHEYRRGLETRFNSSFDFHAWLLSVSSLGTVRNEQSVTINLRSACYGTVM